MPRNPRLTTEKFAIHQIYVKALPITSRGSRHLGLVFKRRHLAALRHRYIDNTPTQRETQDWVNAFTTPFTPSNLLAELVTKSQRSDQT